MKRRTFHPSALILFSAIIVVFTFAGRSISTIPGRSISTIPGRSIHTLPGRPGDRADTGNDPVTEDIEKIERQYKEAFIKGDSALFLKCYTPDACVLAPNTPQLCGQQGLSQFYKGTFQFGIRDAFFTSLGLFGQTPEYVTQQGAIEVFDAADKSLGKGKVLIVWKKTSEGWRIFRHMLNFDGPASSPK